LVAASSTHGGDEPRVVSGGSGVWHGEASGGAVEAARCPLLRLLVDIVFYLILAQFLLTLVALQLFPIDSIPAKMEVLL
jgi:hypothetical protein